MRNVIGSKELYICCNCAVCELKCEVVVIFGMVNGVMFKGKFPKISGEF